MTRKMTVDVATALAQRAWGEPVRMEQCSKPGAWSFASETGGGIVVDASIVTDAERLLVEPYVDETDGAFLFDQETGWAIAAFALNIWRESDDGKPVFPLDAELTYRKHFFNPRMAAGVARDVIEEHPEMLEHVDDGLEAWAEAHGLDPTDDPQGKVWPGTTGLYAAARAAVEEQRKSLEQEPSLEM